MHTLGRSQNTLQPGTKNKKKAAASNLQRLFKELAEWTGLEPATPGVTGRYSNQLNYHSIAAFRRLLVTDRPSAAKLGDPTGIRTPVLTVKG